LPYPGEYIVFVGGFQPWHGIDLILDAFCLIWEKRPEAKLVLVGDGPLSSSIHDRASALGIQERVIFTGLVDQTEVARLLSAASIAVIYHRGSAAEIVETPLKLFEYMAAGKAIVAPAVLNMERILTDRVSAILVPPDNPDALASAFIELLEDEKLRTDLGSRARQEAIEKHSWDRAVRELEILLYRVLDRNPNKTYEVDYVSGQTYS
jgi:glycosyltransferase involved in cell wall biosynthesis